MVIRVLGMSDPWGYRVMLVIEVIVFILKYYA